MKNIKLFSFTTLIVLLVMSSCTMQKRVYNKGYHIEWNKKNHSNSRTETKKEQRTVPYEQNLAQETEEESSPISPIDSVVPSERPILASNENTTPILGSTSRINLFDNLKEKRIVLENTIQAKTNTSFKKETKQTSDTDEATRETSIAAVLGLTFGLLIYVFTFASLFFAFSIVLLLCSILLCLIFCIIGLKETSSGEKLGRGFAIAGLILLIFYLLLFLLLLFLLILLWF